MSGDPGSLCRNCGAALQGRFCHSCGQRATSAFVTVHDFIHEALHEYLHVDGKIVQTMRLLLFSPGKLTREHLAGRRARYISPIRLYLLWSVAYFAFIGLVAQADPSKQAQPPSGNWIGEHDTNIGKVDRLQQEARKFKGERKSLSGTFREWLPTAMFALLPMLGLMLRVVYRKTIHFYLPHLYFAIHLHAFVFCLLLLAEVARWGTTRAIGSSSFLVLATNGLKFAIFPYYFIALRRVYGATWVGTTLRGVAVGCAYVMLLLTTAMAIGITAFFARAL